MKIMIPTSLVRLRAICAGLLAMAGIAVPTVADAQLLTLTDGGATYTIPAASHYDNTQTSNLTGVGAGDYLFEDGWWFRVSGDTQEFSFPAPTTTTSAGNTGTVTWTDVNGRGLFGATNTLTLTSTATGTGRLVLTMSITNLSAVAPLTMSLFHGADFDVNGTAGTDSATLLTPNTHIRIQDATAGFAEYKALNPSATAYLVKPFAATTDVFGLLADTAVTNFDNTGLPATSFDYTGAFQWDLVIPAGGTRSVSVELAGNVALPLSTPGLSINDVAVDEGDTGTTAFTFNVSLDGPAPAGGVTFDIATADSTAQSPGDYAAQSLTGQTIPAGSSGPYEFTVLVNGDSVAETDENFFVNVTNVVGANTVDAQGQGTITNEDFSADLAITKTDGVTSVVPGATTVTYTITASNSGPNPVVGATVTDTLPASLTGAMWTAVGAGGGTASASGSGNISDTVNLPAGGSVTYTVSATVSASATGTLQNTATVTAPLGIDDSNLPNNEATDTDILTPEADLSITVAISNPAIGPGDPVTYTLVVTNNGPSDVVGATVADVFPASLTGVTWTSLGAGGGMGTPAGVGDINDSVNLPVGGSVTYTVTATVAANASGSLINTASVAAPGGVTDTNGGNDDDTDTVPALLIPPVVGEAAELSLSEAKPFGDVTVNRRGRPSQKITITNTGDLPVEKIQVNLSGSGKKDFRVKPPLAKALEPGETTTFEATFRPRKTGTRKATVVVTSTALPVSMELTGNGESARPDRGPKGPPVTAP